MRNEPKFKALVQTDARNRENVPGNGSFDGIQVIDDKGHHLDVSLLSSGEKQLMLLLCNILVATTQPSLFIIDEPELSLNVKWQRELVDSLLSLVEGSHVQFIMATHSIEVLTRHKDCVLQLEDNGNTI